MPILALKKPVKEVKFSNMQKVSYLPSNNPLLKDMAIACLFAEIIFCPLHQNIQELPQKYEVLIL